jgi:demethylmenaquinone methyltransferase/2-methoxy-6-polyprenyl-1,4-benzoquinol methylase
MVTLESDRTVKDDRPTPGSGAMFDRIAARYDRLNRLLSAGVDRRWRRLAASALALPRRGRVLDLATGTCDLALAVLERWPDAEVIGIDPSSAMLRLGKLKAACAGNERLRLAGADAQRLPFADQVFDSACIAFGIRNLPDRMRGLGEIRRVVRPGGRVAVLELTEPGRGALGRLARLHVHHVVPRIGALLSGAPEYRYLERSIAAFPPAATFANSMVASGLRVLAVERLTLGVCHLFVAEVPR